MRVLQGDCLAVAENDPLDEHRDRGLHPHQDLVEGKCLDPLRDGHGGACSLSPDEIHNDRRDHDVAKRQEPPACFSAMVTMLSEPVRIRTPMIASPMFSS